MKSVFAVINCEIDDYYIIAIYKNQKKAQQRADAENAKHTLKSVIVEEFKLEK